MICQGSLAGCLSLANGPSKWMVQLLTELLHPYASVDSVGARYLPRGFQLPHEARLGERKTYSTGSSVEKVVTRIQ